MDSAPNSVSMAVNFCGDFVEGFVPGNGGPLPCPFGADAAQGLGQAIGMVDALGITGDFFADDAGGVGIILGAADAADGVIVDDFDIERAGRWAIVRADRTGDAGDDGFVHWGLGACCGGKVREGKTGLNVIVVIGGMNGRDGAPRGGDRAVMGSCGNGETMVSLCG